MSIELLLIEDELQDAKNIVASVANIFQTEPQFHIEHLPGRSNETTIRGRAYRFYDESVIDEIRQRIERSDNGTQIGLLLDVVLAQDEMESKNKNFYPEVKVARKIYDAFWDKVPIYIVTSVTNFFTHSVKIMGAELSDRFILKDVLVKYKTQSMIDKFKDYYIDWENNNNGQKV